MSCRFNKWKLSIIFHLIFYNGFVLVITCFQDNFFSSNSRLSIFLFEFTFVVCFSLITRIFCLCFYRILAFLFTHLEFFHMFYNITFLSIYEKQHLIILEKTTKRRYNRIFQEPHEATVLARRNRIGQPKQDVIFFWQRSSNIIKTLVEHCDNDTSAF